MALQQSARDLTCPIFPKTHLTVSAFVPSYEKSLIAVYASLAQAGVNRAYLRKNVLPEWWDDKVAQTAAGFTEAATLIARRLGLDVTALINEQAVRWNKTTPVSFKKADGVTEADVALARQITVQALRIAVVPQAGSPVSLARSAAEVRDAIFSAGHRTVHLQNLLNYCWSAGIPVLHVDTFPAKSRKMEGLACQLAGRPAIALNKSLKSPAWAVFLLAHELGHLVCGHVGANGVVVDAQVRQDASDAQEQEANAFAVELLTGSPSMRFTARSGLNASQLAQAARDVGARVNVEPGVVALNYAWHCQRLPVAQAALKQIEGEADAIAMTQLKAEEALGLAGISDADIEFLGKLGALPAASPCVA